MKKTCVIFLLLLSAFSGYTQEPELSKKQMYADFDELVQIIRKCNPQLEVREIVTGYHQIDTILELRKNIEIITNYSDFRSLLNQVLFHVLDPHTYETYSYYDCDNLEHIDTAAMSDRNAYYHSDAYRKIMNGSGKACKLMSFPIGAFYLHEDDSYWLTGSIKIINRDKTDSIQFDCLKIVSYDNQPFERYVENYHTLDLRYNFQRQKYYYGGNFGLNIPGSGHLKGIQDGKVVEFDIEDYPAHFVSSVADNKEIDSILKNVPNKQRPYFIYNKKVEFFESDSILYIYIDLMEVDTGFCNQIKEVAKNKTIKCVVIDVRDNLGGNDDCWQNVLKAIIKDPLTYNIKLALNKNRMMKDKFKGYHYPNKCERIKWLGNKKFMIMDYTNTIEPDTNSINYEGKIYILSNKDTYSAGHSLVDVGNQLDQFVTIGTNTGHIVGLGINPQLFQLKHSKFSFRLACTIDVYNCDKAIDVYKDFPKVMVAPSAKEELYYCRSKYDCKSEEYLRNFDSMFRKVLELIGESR